MEGLQTPPVTYHVIPCVQNKVEPKHLPQLKTSNHGSPSCYEIIRHLHPPFRKMDGEHNQSHTNSQLMCLLVENIGGSQILANKRAATHLQGNSPVTQKYVLA